MYNMEGHCKFYERERVFKFKIFKGNCESKLEFPKGREVQTNINFGVLIFLKKFFLGPRRGNACRRTKEN